jgi:putative FmdB family regulatory protein
MAVYEYKCISGHPDHVVTEIRGINEDQKTICCPICGDALKQVYSAPLMQLKGTGFYRNSK